MTEATIAQKAPRLLKERQLHSRIFAVALVLTLLVAEPWLPADGLLRQSMLWLGYVLIVAGALGRVYCSVYIGGRKNETVMRDGPFSVVRNPLYVFSFLATVGIGLQSGMVLILVVLIAAFLFYYPHVVAKEEAFLAHRFGDSYAAYMREVPRWLPNLKLWREPEEIAVRPKFVRRTLMDATIFFLPMLGFALLSALHADGILPVWLTLP
jgi:protein-S-isoprenylcysteine O-methyltransferase Ste14